VKKLTGPGTETKDVYSLKKDMAQLRTDGAAKGIVDAGVVDVGTSSEGRELWALKVGKGASHKVLFTGCHHAREWISVEIPYLVAEYLIQNYTSSPTTDKEKRIHHLVENREIWFVPMTNPDGHEYTTRTDRRWRPNRKAYALPGATISAPRFGGGGPRSITYVTKVYTGVDINRNYATSTWGQETFVGPDPTTSRDPNDSGAGSIWCGPAAGSEAETQRISALIAAHGFKAGITYHNYGQLLLYPDAASGDAFVQDVGKGMNTLIAEHGNPYTYQSGSALYPTTGDLMDYSYEKVPGRPAYTPELRPKIPPAPGSWAFSGLPDSQIEPCFKENLGAALALINCAGHASAPGGCTWKLRWGFPPLVCQVVLNCWNVFKGWTP
jgi:carboxypeptidase T